MNDMIAAMSSIHEGMKLEIALDEWTELATARYHMSPTEYRARRLANSIIAYGDGVFDMWAYNHDHEYSQALSWASRVVSK